MLVFALAFISMILVISPVSFGKKVPVPFEYATVQDYQQITGKRIAHFNEAPMLSQLVKQGKLPPIKERLPQDPKVIVPVEEVGQYGGTWRRAWLGPSDAYGPWKLMEETIVQYNATGTKIVANIADRWSMSKDGRVFTFHLRKGIKWSDGEPFTADDILYQFEDVLFNKDLTPTFPKWLTAGGKPVEVEKVDDYTVKFSFAQPYPLFLNQFAIQSHALYAPKHYMKQFNPKYTSEAKLNERAKAAGFASWYQLYLAKEDAWWVNDPDRPTIWAWKAENSPTSPQFRMVRNPYYWKVDTAGNQLPYIDTIVNILTENADMVNLKAMTGELDMQWRHILASNYTVFMENRDKGDYRVIVWKSAQGSNPTICFNLTCKDPVLRKLFNDDRFRKALSIAINREEINELVFSGLAVPRQASLIPEVPYYSPEWEKAWAQYDPKKANAMLDELGLVKRDKDGYRLRPDGKRLAVTIEYMQAIGFASDVCELIKQYWENIGVATALKVDERSLYTARRQGNETEITIEGMSAQVPFLTESKWIIPSTTLDHWGIEYARWYITNGKAGEKPPADIAKLFNLWDQIGATVDEKKRDELVNEMIDLHIKNIWFIGTVGMAPTIAIVKNDFRNVPEGILDCSLNTPRHAEPSQFFIKQR